MSLTLSTEDVLRLQSALTALLSPLDATTLDGWGVASRTDTDDVDVLLRHPRRELGLEWCEPNRAQDTLGMRVDEGQRGELVQLLLPAFTAGRHTYGRLMQHRTALLHLLNALDAGFHIFDERGAPLHQNAGLRRLLEADPQAHQIRDQIPRIALAVADVLGRHAGTRPEPADATFGEVRTALATYQLRGFVFGEGLFGSEVIIAVSVERVTAEAASDQMLMEQHRLTRREVAVARCLGRGDSSKEIAKSLGITRHTARHHTESVMRKLGVRSRSAVAAGLRRV